jgi:hypothetical protein
MAISFLDLWNRLNEEAEAEDQNGPLLDSGEESSAMRVIRTGLSFDGDFWENFKSICNDSDGLADLLEIPKVKITGWASKIDELIEKVQSKDGDAEASNKKSEMIPTGNEPAAEPEGTDSNADGPAETRPTP